MFVRLGDVVGTDRDKPAIGANLHLAVEFNKPFSLSAVLGAETAAAEDEDHGMLALQLGELPAFRRVVGKFVVGKMAAGPMSDRIRSPQFDAWRVNLARVRKRDKPRDPIVCRVRKARRADLVDPAGALGARTQGGVAARPQGTLLSLRQNL